MSLLLEGRFKQKHKDSEEKNKNQSLGQKGIMMAQLQILHQRKLPCFYQTTFNILNISLSVYKIKISPLCIKYYYCKTSPNITSEKMLTQKEM